MDFEGWIDGYKVRVMKWIDGKHIYINVQYFKPGTSIQKPPAMDKSAFIVDDKMGRNMVKNYLSTLVNYIARSEIKHGNQTYITVESGGLVRKTL